MKIALLTDSIDHGLAGFGTYVASLAKALIETPGEDSYILVHPKDSAFYEGMPNLIAPAARAHVPLVGTQLARQMCLPPFLQAQAFDLVHDTYHYAPFLRPSGYKRVMTIGDLTPLVASFHPRRQTIEHRFLVRLIALRAHHIVTFSEASKWDIARLYHIRPERISVTNLAADARFSPNTDENDQAIRRGLGLPTKYILYVGTIEPRKNVGRLLDAFARVRGRLVDVQLVLVGRQGWTDDVGGEIQRRGLASRVLHLSAVTAEELPAVYRGAEFLAYPSLYEGFGLPPLEAMQSGTPVLTSNSSSLPEVVGDAALLVDPHLVEAIAAALVRLSSDASLRAELRARGLKRAALFSWQKCAAATRAAYELTLQRRL